MPYLFQILKMAALAVVVSLSVNHLLSTPDSALVGVSAFYLLLVRAS